MLRWHQCTGIVACTRLNDLILCLRCDRCGRILIVLCLLNGALLDNQFLLWSRFQNVIS